ncbi:MAG: nitroreductase family protein [Burkholderiales bacterium]
MTMDAGAPNARAGLGVVRKTARAALRAFPSLRDAYHLLRRRTVLGRRLLFHLRDAAHTYRHMRWDGCRRNYWKLSSELIFYFHKIEKGLCMPDRRSHFGADSATRLVSLIEHWRKEGYGTNDPVYLGALECLRAYRIQVETSPLASGGTGRLASQIDRCMNDSPRRPEFETPTTAIQCAPDVSVALWQLCRARRSVRAYRPDPVPQQDVHEAIALAQSSPSACNRQPWRVHLYRDRRQMDALLALQNGNRGFGERIPLLLVITADADGFFDASERNQPYIDAGLFVMTLLLALQARGLSTCCLNWCITNPGLDVKAHRHGSIPENERIIMYIAVGYADQNALVPRSVRRNIESFMVVH